MRYFVLFSYLGKNYHGWQKQPQSISVQEVMQDAFQRLLREPIELVGAGRTDTGVHAHQMYAHFDTQQKISNQLVYRLNAYLPKDIVIHSFREVIPKAHARFDALKRTYRYRISQEKSAFTFEQAYFMNLPLDVSAMNEACEVLLCYKDFQCFSKSNTDVKTYLCDIYSAGWYQKGSELIFEISANRFLRNMVRAIVGTFIQVGLRKMSIAEFTQVIESKSRSRAGVSAPAHGLSLIEIEYPDNIWLSSEIK